MRCPKCNYRKLHVIKSLDLSKAVKRKRECYKCGARIETIELFDPDGFKSDEPKINERLTRLELEIEDLKKNKDL
tara:strand:+ start:2766 stop:2990 length:225 start_codon:yes stop_codon:yes gene_type:complete